MWADVGAKGCGYRCSLDVDDGYIDRMGRTFLSIGSPNAGIKF